MEARVGGIGGGGRQEGREEGDFIIDIFPPLYCIHKGLGQIQSMNKTPRFLPPQIQNCSQRATPRCVNNLTFN